MSVSGNDSHSRKHYDVFTEWSPHPIVELNLEGGVSYLNLAARAQFPTLATAKSHPILAGLIDKAKTLSKVQGEFVVFFREINYLSHVFEQQVFVVANKQSLFIYMNDISERKFAEKQLKERNNELLDKTDFLNNILESSIEYSLIATDLEGMILAWNSGAALNYGYEAHEMVGKKNIRSLYTPEDLENKRVADFFDQVLKNGKSEDVFERVRNNGSHFFASVLMSVRRNASGHAIGFLVISRDITEQKRWEEQLRINQQLEEQNKLSFEANRLKNEFLANMSHELRTPLNAVIGFSEVLAAETLGSLNADQKDSLNSVVVSAKHLLRIINDLLDLTHMQFSQVHFEPEMFHVREQVDEVVSYFHALALQKGVSLTVNIDPSINTAFLDPARFKQILYNYLANAIKFIPAQGKIRVRIFPENDQYFRIEIEDNGEAIKPEDLRKIFVAFSQVDSSSSKRYAGMGLGLILTKHIVEEQGGRVGVNAVPGVGNIFYAVLPFEYYPGHKKNRPEKS